MRKEGIILLLLFADLPELTGGVKQLCKSSLLPNLEVLLITVLVLPVPTLLFRLSRQPHQNRVAKYPMVHVPPSQQL